MNVTNNLKEMGTFQSKEVQASCCWLKIQQYRTIVSQHREMLSGEGRKRNPKTYLTTTTFEGNKDFKDLRK